MKITFAKTELNNKTDTGRKLEELTPEFKDISKNYNEDEIFSLVLSAIRANDANVVDTKETKGRTHYIVDSEKVRYWIEKRLVPNTIQISVEDKELLKLLIFSLATPYKMLEGEIKATKSEKVQQGERYILNNSLLKSSRRK